MIACPHMLGLAVSLVMAISATSAAQNGMLNEQLIHPGRKYTRSLLRIRRFASGWNRSGHNDPTTKLRSVIDFSVSSRFVHYRKPDKDLHRIALDIAQQIRQKFWFPNQETLLLINIQKGNNG